MFLKTTFISLTFLCAFAATRVSAAPEEAIPSLTPLDVDCVPVEWQKRIEELQSKQLLKVPFEEARYLAFRLEPKEYEGVFRRFASGSISLAYEEPEPLVIQVSEDSIMIRKGDSESVRELSKSRAADAGLGIFRSLLNLDLAGLADQYDLFSGSTGEAWLLECRVKDDLEQNPKYKLLRIEGSEGQLNAIELQESPRRRVEISLATPEYPQSFSPEVLSKYCLEQP